VPKVRRGIFDVHVQEDRVLRRDLRRHRQPQERVDVRHGWRTTQLGLRHDRHAHTLLHEGLNVVLGYHTRTGKNLQQAAGLRHREDGVDTNVVAEVQEVQTAGRLSYA